MNLVTSNQYQLTADSSPLANALHQRFAQNKVEDKAQAEKDKLNQLASVIANGTPEEKQAAQQQLALLNPQASNALTSVVTNQQEQRIKAAQEQLKKNALTAFSIRDLPDITSKRTAIAKEAQQALKDGEDITEYEKLMQIDDVDELNLALTQIAMKAADVDKVIESQMNPKAPQTREIKKGDQVITQEFNKTTGRFEDIAESDRFKSDVLSDEALAQKKEIAEASKSEGASVHVKAFEEEEGKLNARSNNEVSNEIRSNARSAARSKGRIKNLQRTLVGAKQGALSQFIPAISKIIPGIDATDEQAAAAQINDFVLDKMSAFKGSTSEKELDFAKQTITNLGNTPEANQIVIRSFLNAAFLAEQENEQFNAFTKGGGKAREFVFDFDSVAIKGHSKHGDVTLSDIQETAIANGITMEEVMDKLKAQ